MKTPAQLAEEARQAGRDGLDTVRGLASDARDIAGDAAATGRAYAKDAVNAAGRKLHDARGQFEQARQACMTYIADEPVKAALISAAAGAVLTTLALSLLRGRRRD
ncbi:hypothetical protein [Variovorax saccharolyticus]|uniref:hypothetical protein n=1 Tax=Variovorax saccharolyticus TaxID=3053516 RepID=UPI002578B672|nr:hypothetical protein [Variovorax sp. J31P216]MDM0026395.1 hypothetical protein [Variovorax sp. J31P216]